MMLFLVNWFGQGASDVPPNVQPRTDNARMDAGDVRPFGYTRRDSIVGNQSVRAFISTLFFPCGPTAIVRRIALQIVNAINRRSAWPRTHILVEVGKVAPSVADSDSAASVRWVGYVLWIGATLQHRIPSTITEAAILPLRQPVASAAFYVKAAATLRVSAVEVSRRCASVAAAIAKAFPSARLVSSSGVALAGYNQATEALADERVTVCCSHGLSCSIGAFVVRGWTSLTTASGLALFYLSGGTFA